MRAFPYKHYSLEMKMGSLLIVLYRLKFISHTTFIDAWLLLNDRLGHLDVGLHSYGTSYKAGHHV